MTTQTEPGHWLKKFCLLLVSPKMLVMLLTGFSSGLPLLLIGSTLKFWMREEGLDLTTIGFFGLVGLPYTLKFLWAPVMDRLVPSALGRRRGWMLGTQVALMITIASLAFTQPAMHLPTLAVLCLLVAFFSASQDIVLDAYRRESLSDEELGIGSSMFIYGYRLGMLTAGALALFLADQESLSWNAVYFIMGAMMIIGILTTWFAPEPTIPAPPPASWQEAITGPFLDFFSRPGALMMSGVYPVV